jgi:hypothetical protein
MYYQRKGLRGIVAGLQLAVATLLLMPMSFAQQTPASAAAGVSAQAATTTVPNLIRYSGTLKGEEGAAAPLPATVGATFAIYKQQDGGAPIWMETQNVSADASGQYSVLLGSTRTEGVPAELFSDQEQRWLGVQAQGQPEQARVLLVSVPYALRAHDSETLGGLPASAFAQVSTTQAGLSPIGSSAPLKASAGPATNASADPEVAVTGTGTAKYIPVWATASKIVDSVIYQKSPTLVGVGTTTPSAQLDVYGAINTSPTSVAGSNTGNYQILENPILSIGWPAPVSVANNNLFVGYYAGQQGFAGTPVPNGTGDTFVGSQAGFHNLSGSNDTAVGYLAGYRNETGSYNVSVGADAAFGVSGVSTSYNTVMGDDAGANNTASNIAFFGYQAGLNNTGGGNSFVGYQSGIANTGGNNNTFLGSQSGYSNTTGAANTFLGQGAGQNNTTANGNTFTGQGAGQNNTTGDDNTFDGNGAGNANTTGSLNAFTGEAAGSANTTGSDNTFDGWAAGLANTTASNNAFFGFESGSTNTTGAQNTFLGAYAGYVNVTGQDNTFVGYGTGPAFTAGQSNIFLGFAAGNNNTGGSNDIYIGNEGCAPPCTEGGVVRIGTAGFQTSVYVAGINGVMIPPADAPPAGAPLVCVDPITGLLGTQGCAATGQVLSDQQQRQIQAQVQQIADLQQRLSRLESLIAKQ